jgi:hypothetical protein
VTIQELIDSLSTLDPERTVLIDDGEELYRLRLLIGFPDEPYYIIRGEVA